MVIFLPRAKNAKAEDALKLYKQGILLVDIAKQLGVPAGTIRRWKSTYKWDGMSSKSERSEKRSEHSEKRGIQNVDDDIASVIANNKLTDEQKLFCLYYIRSFNATKSYQKAYGCNYKTAGTLAGRLLGKVEIRSEINRLKQNRYQRELINESDIFQKYLDIAFADITDYIDIKTEEEYVIGRDGVAMCNDPDTGEVKFLTRKVNTLLLKETEDIDGTLISEIKFGKSGTTIKLPDRMRALDWIADHMEMATEEQKARIEALKAKSVTSGTEEIDSSYVDALKGLADRVWDDESG